MSNKHFEINNSSWFVYILLCHDGTLYTGCTTDVARRFTQHQSGKGGRYTRSHKPLEVVYQEQLPSHSAALKREAEIKSWNRAKKIEALGLEVGWL